jgi:D-erythrulose 4-phosphate isomerase
VPARSEPINPREKDKDMKLAIAGDSAGEGLAKILAEHLAASHEVVEISHGPEGPDLFYANMSDRVASAVLAGEYDRAILICGTGIGVCLAANKVPGIRAAQCHDTYSAGKAATSNNAQIITMGARVIGPELAKDIAQAFLSAAFDPEGRSAGNVQAIDALDAKYHMS